MPVINVLSPHVADLIAAGEVVERPSSVIKELVENSFDSGAHKITVEVRRGGTTYIRVTDDGCGMSPEDAGVAFLRHATSKLHDEQGLEAISTMGFRGEALAAISAVSRITLTTRMHDSLEGIRVELEAGDITDMLPCGCPEGTSMIVRDLFYNTPARQKFLKSDRSESAACALTALRCAMGHPDISVRFIRDGEEEFFTPGDGSIESCIYALMGREFGSAMLSCEGDSDGITVSGFISSPAAVHGNRGKQFFFCNGRYIRSQLLQTALEQAYRNSILTGRYPACVLFITLGFGRVDVNVHPAKTEVKFSDEKQVYDAVYYAALSALQRESITAQVRLPSSGSSKSSGSAGDNSFFRSMTGKEFRDSVSSGTTVTQSQEKRFNAADSGVQSSIPLDAPVIYTGPCTCVNSTSTPNTPSASAPAASIKAADTTTPGPASATASAKACADTSALTAASAQAPQYSRTAAKTSQLFAQSTDNISPTATISTVSTVSSSTDKENVGFSVQNVEISPRPTYKIVGEALKTYIIVEQNDQILLIDKHAAHERLLFDSLRENSSEHASQALLNPVTLRLSSEDAELLENAGSLLSGLGFEIDAFGIDSYIVRAVPAGMDPAETLPAVEEICEKLRSCSDISLDNGLDEILHTVACKAAIKAGWDTDSAEFTNLVDAVVTGKIRYCPHGRPVAVTLTHAELDRFFKRIV